MSSRKGFSSIYVRVKDFIQNDVKLLKREGFIILAEGKPGCGGYVVVDEKI